MKATDPRWIVRVLVILATVAVSVGATLFWSELHKLDKPPVFLTSGPAGTWASVSDRFNKRVQHAFPIGSSESHMGQELSKEGFAQVDWGGATGKEHEAVRREDTFVCLQAARIYWRATGNGRIVSIRGTYGEEGCL